MLITRVVIILLAMVLVPASQADTPLAGDATDSAGSLATPKAPFRSSDGFRAFSRDIERLNDRQIKARGYPSFIKVDEIGTGHVQLVAHKRWAAASLTDRQSSLQTMVNLLALRMAREEGVTLLITDSSGLPLMKGSR